MKLSTMVKYMFPQWGRDLLLTERASSWCLFYLSTFACIKKLHEEIYNFWLSFNQPAWPWMQQNIFTRLSTYILLHNRRITVWQDTQKRLNSTGRRKIRRVVHAINNLTQQFSQTFISDSLRLSQISNKNITKFSIQRSYRLQLPVVRGNFWPPYKWRMA
jgi:hypothetical protein